MQQQGGQEIHSQGHQGEGHQGAALAVAVPHAGTFTEYARAGLGRWAGFTAGWLYWYFWAVVIGIEAIAGAGIVALWVDLPVWLIGTVLTLLMAGSNLLSARSFGEFEFWFSTIKVEAIALFIILASLGLSVAWRKRGGASMLVAGSVVALANKESLIVGGPLVKAIAAPDQLVPVDSEHSALAQCLRAGRASEVKRLLLTASGC